MIAGFYAAILGLMLVGLILNVVRKRWKYRVGIGDGGIEDLSKAIRVHGNFTETMPFALIILGLLELGNAAVWCVHLFGIILVIARALHMWGLSGSIGTSKGRLLGTVLTVTLILAGSMGLLYLYLANKIS